MQWTRPKASGTATPPLQKHTSVIIGCKIYIIGGSYYKQESGKQLEVFNSTLIFDTGLCEIKFKHINYLILKIIKYFSQK